MTLPSAIGLKVLFSSQHMRTSLDLCQGSLVPFEQVRPHAGQCTVDNSLTDTFSSAGDSSPIGSECECK